MMGCRPDSTLGKRKIVIGMLTAGMMNMQIARHFQACVRYPILEPKSVVWVVSKIDIMPTDRVRPPGEMTLTM